MADTLNLGNAGTLTPEMYAQQQQVNRQQQLANMLLQNSQQQPQGQMISGHYVAPSFTQNLVPLANALAGQYLGNKADTQAAALAQQLRTIGNREVSDILTTAKADPNAALNKAITAQTPMGQSLVPQLSKVAINEPTSEIQNYQYGEKNPNFVNYQTGLKRAGANNISLSTGKSIAEQIGPMMTNSANQAVGALKTNDAADQILGAIKSGNVINGPGANVRIPLARLAGVIGAGGKDDAEKLANTQDMVQNLAKLTLAGRQQMHGEGAISNSESNIAERAMSGNAELSIPEIQQLANAAKRSAAYQVAQHNQKLQVMQSNPETRGLAPYFQVTPLSNAKAPSSNNVVDYNSLK